MQGSVGIGALMNHDPRSLIVLILAIAMAIALIGTAITPIFLGEPISDERTQSVGGVVIAIIAIIAGFVSRNGDK